MGAVAGLALLAVAPFLPMLMRRELPVLRDHADYFIPMRWFTAQVLGQGTIPLWNPLNGLGEPWFANPQTGVLYPPTWLHVLLPFEIGYVLYLAFHLALLSAGVFVAARRFAPRLESLVAAVLIMFCGPVFSLLDVSNNLASLAWVPWVIAAAVLPRDWQWRALAGGIALAGCFLAAEPTFAAIGAAVFSMLCGASRGALRDRTRAVAGAGLLALLLSAPQLLPFIHTLGGSDRTTGLAADAAFAHSLGAADFLNTAIPPPADDRASAHVPASQQFLPITYVSISVLGLLVLGSVTLVSRKDTVSALLTGTALILLLTASIGSIPVMEHALGGLISFVRHPARYLSVALVLVSPILAAGIARFPQSTRFMIPVGVAFCAVAVWLLVVAGPGEALVALLVDAIALVVLAVPASVRRVFRVSGFGVLLCGTLVWSSSALLISDSLDAVKPVFDPPRAGSRAAVQNPDDVSVMRRSRVSVPFGYSNLLVGVSKMDTPAPVVPRAVLSYTGAAFEIAPARLLTLAAVGAVWTDERGWREHTPIPMVSGWNGATRVSSELEALELLIRGRSSGLLYTSGELPVVDMPDRKPVRVQIRGSLAESFLTVDAPEPVVLMISERADEGWSVWLDGQPWTWAPVNGVFRGVAVPAGAHTLRWRYSPPGWTAGWSGFFLGLLACAALLVAAVRPRQAR